MTEQEYGQRKTGYIEEWTRIRELVKMRDPLSEDYKTLLVRMMSIEKSIAALDAAWIKETIDLKVMDFKSSKENFDEELKSQQLELERETAAEKAALEREKLEQELKKEKIQAGEELATTALKGGFGLAQSIVAGKVLLAMAEGVLSDEQKGKLTLSRVLSLIPKPNVWTIRV